MIPPRLQRTVSAACLLAALTACQKAPEQASQQVAEKAPAGDVAPAVATAAAVKTVSAEPSSFDAVARHLDAGGGLYLYVSAEGVAKTCGELIAKAEAALFEEGGLPAGQKEPASAAWKVIKPILSRSGLGEITGFGMSSIATKPGYYRMKSILHHEEGKGNGFLWKLNGGQSRALELIGYLPTDTAAAGSFDVTLEPLWEALNRQAADSPELRAALDGATQQLMASSGLDISKLLAGFGPNISYVVTLDENKPFAVPSPKAVSIPEPRIALLIQIRDEALTQRLESELAKLPNVAAADQSDMKVRKIATPLPFPFLTPTIAWTKNLLIVSSNEALIQEMLEVKAGKRPGVSGTDSFKTAMEGLPSPATSFSYVSPLFGKTVGELQTLSLEQPGNTTSPAIKQLMQAIMLQQGSAPAATVGQTLPDGLVTVGNTGVGPRQIAAMGMGVPVGIIAGAAAPVAKAKASAQGRATANPNPEAVHVLEALRLIEAARDQWALENNAKEGSQMTTEGLKMYLKKGSFLHEACEQSPRATSVVLVTGLQAVELAPVGKQIRVPSEIVDEFSGECPRGFWGNFAKE